MAKRGSRPAKTAVLVEVGSEWLKIVQAEPRRGGATISKIHLERISGPGRAAADQIKSALKKGRFARIPVIGCLPRQMMTIRMLELPSTDLEEIADMVDLQIGKQTPYSRDEIAFDYRVVGSARDGYTRVMLTIVQRSTIRERYYMLEEAGVDVERMSVSAEGMLNWCAASFPRRSASAVLDVDSSHSDLAVMVNGVLVFTKNISIGAEQLLAEPAKWQDKLGMEVRRSLETCEGELPGVKLGKLVVCGAGVNVPSFEKHIGDQLGILTEGRGSLAPAGKAPKSPSLDDPQYASASLTAIVGMALDPGSLEFNLMPDSVVLRKELTEKAESLTTMSMLTMSVLVVGSMYASVDLFVKNGRLRAIDAELGKTGPTVEALAEMRDTIKLVNSRSNRKFTAMNLLSHIHPLVPENVSFDSLEFDRAKGQVLLGGLAASRPDVRTMVKNLEQSPFFKDVKQTQNRAEKDMFRFQVACTLEINE